MIGPRYSLFFPRIRRANALAAEIGPSSGEFDIRIGLADLLRDRSRLSSLEVMVFVVK